jgi:hypothetical protein
MSMTAKVRLEYMQTPGGGGEGTSTLRFGPNYSDDKNQEWATATPALSLTMTVKDEVVARQGLKVGDAITLTFEKEV